MVQWDDRTGDVVGCNGWCFGFSFKPIHFLRFVGLGFLVLFNDAVQMAYADDSDFPDFITSTTQRSNFFGIVSRLNFTKNNHFNRMKSL
jgi:hypothetical protein